MTRLPTHVALIALLLAAAPLARAEDACCPADGAPAAAPAAQTSNPAAVPEGHPELPAGHPPMGGMPGMAGGSLPQGHPPLSAMGDQETVIGTLIVKAAQGTPDAPGLGGRTALVRLFNQAGEVVDQREAQLDDAGMAVLDDLTITGLVQPVVTLDYQGIVYEAVGKPMNAMQADQIVRLSVYEKAEARPDWSIKMRHVMVRKIEGGLQVTEMLAIHNPLNRTWVGELVEHGEGDDAHTHDQPVTFSLDLPDGAQHVTIGQGFKRENGGHLEAGQLLSTTPLFPGTVQYQVSYLLAAEGDTATLEVASPAPVAALMVFVPEDGRKVVAEGLTAGDAFTSGNSTVRMYSAHQLGADQRVKLAIEVAPAAPRAAAPAGSSAMPAAGGLSLPQIVAGVGAGALIFGAIALAAVRGRQTKAAHHAGASA